MKEQLELFEKRQPSLFDKIQKLENTKYMQIKSLVNACSNAEHPILRLKKGNDYYCSIKVTEPIRHNCLYRSDELIFLDNKREYMGITYTAYKCKR